MSTLNQFVSAIKSNGLMQTNRFTIEFSLPITLRESKTGFNFTGDMRKVLLYCDAVNLPGMTIATQQARIYGELREMPYDRLFENINSKPDK